MKPSAFITRFLLLALALAAGVAAINVVLDPYLLFNTPRVPGMSDRKPAVATHERQMKEYDAVRRPARTLILGSSRTDIAFDPLSKAWRDEDQPVYNMSLVGSGPGTSVHYLQHFLSTRTATDRPRTLVVGLDFESFLFRPLSKSTQAAAAPPIAATSLRVLPDGRPNPDRTIESLRNYAIATLSLDALLDSMYSAASSARGTGVNLDVRGRMDEGAFQESAATNGIGALFLQKNTDTVRQYSQPRQVLSDVPGGPIRDMASLRQLITIGNSIDAEMVLFVQPSHVDRLELFDRMGYWADMERWKAAIAALVDEKRQSGANVVFWDFAGYEPMMQEPPPARGDRTSRLKWFWEPAHYTSALGDLMIARMRHGEGATAFGTLISSDTIGARLRQISADRDAYRSRAPAETRRTLEVFCSVSACKPNSP